jgi:hypothetical protein
MTIVISINKHKWKWLLYHLGWSDDYCLKHDIDKMGHGYHNDRFTCPECDKEEREKLDTK